MNCPVCNRNNAVTLSICPSCGAMVDDSVREELKDKIFKPAAVERKPFVPDAKPVTFETKPRMSEPTPRMPEPTPRMPEPTPTFEPKPFVPKTFEAQAISSKEIEAPKIPKPDMPLVQPQPEKTLIATAEKSLIAAKIEKPVIAPKPERTETAEIGVKNTVPTLIEFRTEKATVPEWRLHLQNAVQQRQNRVGADVQTAPQATLVTNGATALKPETQVQPKRIFHENPTVNSALLRIEQSRRQFLAEEPTETEALFTDEPAGKTFPYRIATKDGETMPVPEVKPRPAKINVTLKPKAPATLKTETKEFDTNKLPKIPAKISARFEKDEKILEDEELKFVDGEELFEDDAEFEEADDLAPFAMRFNAGLFDLIIGAFLSFVLLVPFMIKSESWFTSSGVIAFAVTCAVVMFIYLTTAVALYGRTFGMRIFALEVVDIEGEEYPTIHQAAVSSCVYIFSLALGGVGFLTLPFNAEKRAVHDLISGTIVVKEV